MLNDAQERKPALRQYLITIFNAADNPMELYEYRCADDQEAWRYAAVLAFEDNAGFYEIECGPENLGRRPVLPTGSA